MTTPDQRRIEVVLDSPADAAPLREVLAGLHGDGWDVVVLVPVASLGAAHRALRGSSCRLQPWWSEDGRVEFGAFEIP